MILASFALALSSLFAFHHAKPRIQHRAPAAPSVVAAPTPQSLYGFDLSTKDMQDQADLFELQVLESLPDVKAKYGDLIPAPVYTALIDDVLKLGNETVLAPTFKADWNKFGDDIDAMSANIEWITSHDRV